MRRVSTGAARAPRWSLGAREGAGGRYQHGVVVQQLPLLVVLRLNRDGWGRHRERARGQLHPNQLPRRSCVATGVAAGDAKSSQ